MADTEAPLTEEEELALILALKPEDGEKHEHRPFRGKIYARQRFLIFLLQQGTHDRCLPFPDMRLIDPEKAGKEIVIEFPGQTAVITGKNLRNAALAMTGGLIGVVEAYDSTRHYKPADRDAPFVESIRFFKPAPKAEDDLKANAT